MQLHSAGSDHDAFVSKQERLAVAVANAIWSPATITPSPVPRMSVPTAAILLFIGALVADVHFSPLVIPLLFLTACSMTGIGLLIGSWAPSWETGGMLAQLIGLVLALMSPVFYPIDRIPEAIRWIAYVSPYTNAGIAVRDVLSDSSVALLPAAMLAIMAVTAFILGVKGFRWRVA